MKKLMIAAAIVCAAVVSQGATMKWGQTTAMKTPDTTKGGEWSETSLGTAGHAYLFELTKAQYDALFVNGTDYASVADTIFDTYATVNDKGRIVVSGSSQDKSSSQSKIKLFTDSRLFFKGEGNVGDTAYAAMIITTTGSDGKDYYIANAASYVFEADADFENGNLGAYEFGNDSGTAIAGWTVAESVPEPTSGLLLLLGMAGLALRRRRA